MDKVLDYCKWLYSNRYDYYIQACRFSERRYIGK